MSKCMGGGLILVKNVIANCYRRYIKKSDKTTFVLRDDYGDINEDAIALLSKKFCTDPLISMKMRYISGNKDTLDPVQICTLLCNIISSHLVDIELESHLPCEHELLSIISLLQRYDHLLQSKAEFKNAHSVVMKTKTTALTAMGTSRYVDVVSMSAKAVEAVCVPIPSGKLQEVMPESDMIYIKNTCMLGGSVMQ